MRPVLVIRVSENQEAERKGPRAAVRKVNAFPVRIAQLDPANLGSQDAHLVGEGDTGLEYCIKTVSKTPRAPAAEYICARLADAKWTRRC